jgi:selenocysteine lyase/cysteine desulfurase
VTGIKPGDLATTLFDKFKIYTVAIDTVPVKGVRVTPHLFTTPSDLDALVAALREIARA